MSSQFYSILFHHILLYHFLFLFNIYYIESHLNSFLSDGRRAFASFLQSEYSQENIEFWVACEDFKQTSVDKMNLKAKMIFERYIDADSPSEVRALLDCTCFIHLSRVKCPHECPFVFFFFF
ncbi:regulator of G-protein signaling [Pimephales promelas]|nr:regulator of G-protein signaling [Pimephales promelas]